MRRIVNSLLLSIVAILLLALPAAAADNGFYLGASFAQSSIATGDLTPINVEDDATGYKAFAGFRFLTFLAVEGAYRDFGDISATPEGSTTSYGADVKGYDLQAVGFIPLGIADIFAKAGYFQWDADVNSGSISSSTDGSDPVYGAGVQFRLKSFCIRGEVEYFDVKDLDSLYMYSIGASYTF
jgi:OOP family OmpA-OmpF porin